MATATQEYQKEIKQMAKTNYNIAYSLAHKKWNCQFYVVFTPKYRRKAFLWFSQIRDKGNTQITVSAEERKYTGSRG